MICESARMWEVAVCILLVLILIYVKDSTVVVVKQRIPESYVVGINNVEPNKMSEDDISNLIRVIESATRTKQLYGNFRDMYPYDITPWQFSKLRILYKKGKLTTENVKIVLGLTDKNPASVFNDSQTDIGNTYSDILGPGTSILVTSAESEAL